MRFRHFWGFLKSWPISHETTRKIKVTEKLGRWSTRRFWGRRVAGGIWTQDLGNLVPEMAVLGSTYFAIDSPSWNVPFCSGKRFGVQIPTSKGPKSPPTVNKNVYVYIYIYIYACMLFLIFCFSWFKLCFLFNIYVFGFQKVFEKGCKNWFFQISLFKFFFSLF